VPAANEVAVVVVPIVVVTVVVLVGALDAIPQEATRAIRSSAGGRMFGRLRVAITFERTIKIPSIE